MSPTPGKAQAAKPKPLTVGSLSDLKQVKKEIAAQAAREAQAAAQRALDARRVREHRSLFQAAVGTVKRLPAHGTASLKPAPPAPTPKQHLLD